MLRSMPLPKSALTLLDRQYGAIGRHQLLEWLRPRCIETLVRRRGLIPIERGVYRVAGGATTRQQAAMAALLRARPGARLTGPFVLGLFDLDGFSVQDPFEILTVPGRQLTGVEFDHRTNPTPEDPVAKHGQLQIAQIAAALVDSGRYLDALGDRRLRLAYDQARWRSIVTAGRVLDRARLLGPADPGAAVFLSWNDRQELMPESEGERDVGAVLSGFDPAPEPQVWVLNYRIDWYWRLYRCGVEYQGSLDHTTAQARLKDTRRFQDLGEAGVQILPVVHSDLEDPDYFARWVHAQLVVRAFELGVPPPAPIAGS
jgi:hypothetical protein